MEYSKEALEEVERLAEVYKRDLLSIAMSKAAYEGQDTKIVQKYHVEQAYDALWD